MLNSLSAAVMLCAQLAVAAPLALAPQGSDGRPPEKTMVTVDGGNIHGWNCDEKSRALTFRPTASVEVPENGVLYAKVDYLDKGYGKLGIELVSEGNKPVRPDRYLRLSRTNSGKVVTAEMRMRGIARPDGRGISMKVGLERPDDEALLISSVELRTEPFRDAAFSYLISDPWLGPYRGPSVKPADNSTLKGKLMTGYQGWFRTPNDPEGRGWVHWGNIQKGEFSVDMWPDVSAYSQPFLEKAAEVRLKSGRQGYLFSSAWPDTVNTHFRWMREHDIDGAFLQRFVADGFNSMNGRPEWVLANVRAAANREGRIWAIEYDVSGYPDEKLLNALKTDWMWFVDTFRVREDANYAREEGKPVVFIWGLPFPDRKISLQTADAVVDFFRNDPKYGGNYVIGGIPNNWRSMSPEWKNHFKKYECVLPWMSSSYASDIADFNELGVSCYAHVKPGFSWANLKHLPSGDDSIAYTPRDGGRHYWKQFTEAAKAGADRVFIGMFDEYDEGTAVIPMSDDSPPTPVRVGIAATFYNGPNPQEGGRFSLLPSAELSLGSPPPVNGIGANDFFVRMGARISFPTVGSYRFFVEGAEGDDVDLVVRGKKILGANNIQGTAGPSAAVDVKQGESAGFRMEYRHRSASGTLRVLWEGPGFARQPLPPDTLQDAWGRFLTNEGMPADWYLKLSRMGKEMMQGKRNHDFPTP